MATTTQTTTLLDWRYKGMPPREAPLPLAELGDQGWNALHDLLMPAMLLLDRPLRANVAGMADWCARQGVKLAPHGKTTMAPEIFRMQLDAGAYGITCATPGHLRSYRAFGVERVVYANELVEPLALRFVADELRRDPAFELLCLADSVAGVALMERELAAAGAPRPISVLVEIGDDGGRTGCRTSDAAVEVARAVAASPQLELAGVEAFEGLRRADDLPAALAGVDAFLGKVTDAFSRIAAEGLLPERPVITAGGSAFFDRVVAAVKALDADVTPILRSGCYVTQDGGFYERVSPLAGRGDHVLANALEIWGAVVSRPEPTLAITSFGRRDVPFDMGLPQPVKLARGGAVRPAPDGCEVIALSDQHGHVRVPADADIAPGDLLGATISHPCGAFDRWRLLYRVDDAYDVLGGVETWF